MFITGSSIAQGRAQNPTVGRHLSMTPWPGALRTFASLDEESVWSLREINVLDGFAEQLTCSLPFERFLLPEKLIEAHRRWRRIDGDLSLQLER
ncbi:MAG: hypothetical protein R6V85_15390 [Polyangia bacterium]